jgi:adenylosuccinate lyase
MLSESKVNLIEPELNKMIDRMANFAENTCSTPMLARTHG